jgi:hypothetical protein
MFYLNEIEKESDRRRLYIKSNWEIRLIADSEHIPYHVSISKIDLINRIIWTRSTLLPKKPIQLKMAI